MDLLETIDKNVRDLERERREVFKAAMKEFDERYYYPNLRSLQERCGEIGHRWKFSHFGPCGDPWYHCVICHKSQVRPDDH